ncbi:MAG: hypothetical protein ACP5D8_10095 [Fidelibacterota bacterium]
MELNAAQQRLNTERSEVLEHHEVVIESREAAFNNSSGTSFSIQMPSAFKHSNISLRSMFKKFYIKYSF